MILYKEFDQGHYIMNSYIIESYKRSLKERTQFLLYNRIPVEILKSFDQFDLNINKILRIIEDLLPQEFFSTIEMIYIGDFKGFEERRIHASYIDGAIYIGNHDFGPDVDNLRIAKDVIHEVAHSIEDKMSRTLFGDSRLVSEFLAKRKSLFARLKAYGHPVPLNPMDPEYSPDMDEYLWQDVGYPVITQFSARLFNDPYSVTSIGEYYSNGFEEFFTGDRNYLQSICPVLVEKIQEVATDLGVRL